MKIALVNYEFPGTTANCGGGGEVTRTLAGGLRDRGHRVRVVTDDGDGHYATFPARKYRDIARAVEWADVVNGHFSIPSSLPLPRLCRRHDTPLVVTVMGADIYDPTRFQQLRPLTGLANRYILRNADAVVTPSKDMAARVRDRFGVDPAVIHYGIDAAEWRPSEDLSGVPEQRIVDEAPDRLPAGKTEEPAAGR